MFYHHYPQKFDEMHLIEDWEGLYAGNGDDIEYLLKDFVSAKFAIGQNPAGVAFEVRSCIVCAERYTTPEQRLRAMARSGLWPMQEVEGRLYFVESGPYCTSVHWESNVPAPMPNIECPDGCILFDTGSYHERFVYILRPVVAEEAA
jgi:hypothetical protein